MERGNGTMIIYSSTFPFIFSFIYEKKREIFASTSSFFLSLPPRNVIITTLEDTRWIKLWPTAALFFPSSLPLSFFFFAFSSFLLSIVWFSVSENYRVPRGYLHVRYRRITRVSEGGLYVYIFQD